MQQIVILIIGLLLSGLMMAQPVNQKDAQGRKHGAWAKTYENGQTRYEGTFKHGKEVGTFTFYYDNGELKAKNTFRESDKVYTRMYGQGEKLAAEGVFVNKKRDSVWTYYDIDGNIVSREAYSNGVKDGMTTAYFPDGKIAEIVEYEDGVKNGVWVQRYSNGRKRAEGKYAQGSLTGTVTYYRQDGSVRIKGDYKNGLKHGNWYYFDTNIKLLKKQVWEKGFPVKSSDEEEQKMIENGNKTLIKPIEKEENAEEDRGSWLERGR